MHDEEPVLHARRAYRVGLRAHLEQFKSICVRGAFGNHILPGQRSRLWALPPKVL
jgi:hypothetical protein